MGEINKQYCFERDGSTKMKVKIKKLKQEVSLTVSRFFNFDFLILTCHRLPHHPAVK